MIKPANHLIVSLSMAALLSCGTNDSQNKIQPDESRQNALDGNDSKAPFTDQDSISRALDNDTANTLDSIPDNTHDKR